MTVIGLGRPAKTKSAFGVDSAGASCIYCCLIPHLIIVTRGVRCAGPWSTSITGKVVKNTNRRTTCHPRSDPHGRTRKGCCITSVSPSKFYGRRVAATSCAYDILSGSSARSSRATSRHRNALSRILSPLRGLCAGNWLVSTETRKRQNASGGNDPEYKNKARQKMRALQAAEDTAQAQEGVPNLLFYTS